MKLPRLRVLPHLIIWVVLVFYFFYSDQIYASFFLKNGKPVEKAVDNSGDVSDFTVEIKDILPIRYDGENLFQVHTWLYTPQGNPAEHYKVWTILKSENHQYVIPAKIGLYYQLPDGRTQSTLLTYLAREFIAPDIYQIGLLIEETAEEEQALLMTNSYAQRTPNTFLFIESLFAIGKPVSRHFTTLPSDSSHIKYSIDFAGQDSDKPSYMYKIYGWSFPSKEFSSLGQTRYLVLISEDQSYFFETRTTSRPDVFRYFPVEAPGEDTGMLSFIDSRTISNGKYRIGILVNSETGEPLLTLTDYNALKEHDQLLFEKLSLP